MKVLIVDDEDLVRKTLQRAFIARGHETLVASGGVDAISVWKESQPDVVMLDVLMPDMSGPEVLERVDTSGTYVVLMSAFMGKYDKESAQNLGACDFIAKPFENIFELIKSVEDSYGAEATKRSSS